jgi:long-chain acyl-CoA synthetase
VDKVLLMHPAVREAASFGVPDAYRGEVLHARVVLDYPVGVEDILTRCRIDLAKHKVPVSMFVVEAVAKTAVDKIDKAALKQAASGP